MINNNKRKLTIEETNIVLKFLWSFYCYHIKVILILTIFLDNLNCHLTYISNNNNSVGVLRLIDIAIKETFSQFEN